MKILHDILGSLSAHASVVEVRRGIHSTVVGRGSAACFRLWRLMPASSGMEKSGNWPTRR